MHFEQDELQGVTYIQEIRKIPQCPDYPELDDLIRHNKLPDSTTTEITPSSALVLIVSISKKNVI